jgi:hypothetical protein
MFRLVVVSVVALAVLGSPAFVSDPHAQLTRWCPGGDGAFLPALPAGNRCFDLDFDGAVGLADFALFGANYSSPPKPYNICVDFDNNGLVTVADFANWASHYGHLGPVVGLCN